MNVKSKIIAMETMKKTLPKDLGELKNREVNK